MAGKYFAVPFSSAGSRSVTPDSVQPDGSVSYAEGFGFDYERPNTDPAYKPVPREGMNGLLFDITTAVGLMQRYGVADWTADAQPYLIDAMVRHNNATWVSRINNNNDEPTEGASWSRVATKADAGGTQLLAQNGHKQFGESGLIVQWGLTPVVPAGSNQTISFPRTFPNGAFAVLLTPNRTDALSASQASAGIVSPNAFSVRNNATVGDDFFFVAIGY